MIDIKLEIRDLEIMRKRARGRETQRRERERKNFAIFSYLSLLLDGFLLLQEHALRAHCSHSHPHTASSLYDVATLHKNWLFSLDPISFCNIKYTYACGCGKSQP